MKDQELAFKEIEEILKKYNLMIKYKLDFPVYKILPNEIKLALSILERHNMRVTFELRPKEQKK